MMTTPPDKMFPNLRYRDPAAAIDWLCKALGFTTHFVAEDGGQVVHAQLRRGDDLLFIGPDHPDDKYGMHSPLALNGTNQMELFVFENEKTRQAVLIARLDNLGKGAGRAALQNVELMLGLA